MKKRTQQSTNGARNGSKSFWSPFSKNERKQNKIIIIISLLCSIVGSAAAAAGELRYFSKECDSIVCRFWSDTSNFFFLLINLPPWGTLCTPFWRTVGNFYCALARSLSERENNTRKEHKQNTESSCCVPFTVSRFYFFSRLTQSPMLQTCFFFFAVVLDIFMYRA